jgi:tRNA (guanine37-N1)-methyltransferase
MKISIITLFPEMIRGFVNESIIKRAIEKKAVEIELVNLRDFAIDDYGSVDDRPYGGGAGMILRVDVINKAIEKIANSESRINKIILTSPKGKVFNQSLADKYSKLDHLIIIAGHYESVDERVTDFIDEEISLGDFVMTGGEITATAITDAVVRLLPGVLKKEEATKNESFFSTPINHLIGVVGEHEILKKLKQKGVESVTLLEYPHYTRPEDFQGKKVPMVLLSGNHKDIEAWRLKAAFEETVKKRPDLLSD